MGGGGARWARSTPLGGTMEHFDESWDEAPSEAEPDLDSDPEELWRSLVADED